MDYKKTNAPATTVTRDMMELCADTGNVYETVAIIGKRANQISVEDKKMDRYRETIDEYYAFKNEFPESKYLKEAEKIFNESQKVIKD